MSNMESFSIFNIHDHLQTEDDLSAYYGSALHYIVEAINATIECKQTVKEVCRLRGITLEDDFFDHNFLYGLLARLENE